MVRPLKELVRIGRQVQRQYDDTRNSRRREYEGKIQMFKDMPRGVDRLPEATRQELEKEVYQLVRDRKLLDESNLKFSETLDAL